MARVRASSRGAAILALLFRTEGILPSKRGRDARDTQGQDALATKTIPKARGLEAATRELPVFYTLS
jgi:hypothetical protein